MNRYCTYSQSGLSSVLHFYNVKKNYKGYFSVLLVGFQIISLAMEICMQHMKSIIVFKSVYNSDYIPIIGEFDLLKMRQVYTVTSIWQ